MLSTWVKPTKLVFIHYHIFFCFSLLSLFVSGNTNFFIYYKHSSLATKIGKRKKSLVGLTPGYFPRLRHKLSTTCKSYCYLFLPCCFLFRHFLVQEKSKLQNHILYRIKYVSLHFLQHVKNYIFFCQIENKMVAEAGNQSKINLFFFKSEKTILRNFHFSSLFKFSMLRLSTSVCYILKKMNNYETT